MTNVTDRRGTSRLIDLGRADHSGGRVTLDVDRLVATRGLINANSGAGKSWTVRRLLEQSHGLVPQHVIDPEGEFHTLRDAFDFVLAGRPGGQKGDCPAEPKSAGLLARKLLELGVSAVIDLFELDRDDRILFVDNYLQAMIDAPRALWRPTLVVIDEAQLFCPEKGEGEAVSRDAVIALMSRGRKRGFGGVLATQRLSKLHKSAAAEANNVFIGRTALDVDLDRAGRALGYDRTQRDALKRLPPGTFHVFGPAVSAGAPGGVLEVRVGDVKTRHPQAGQGEALPAPPRDAVKRVLAQLEDLPAEAAAEARTVDALKAKIAQLELLVSAAARPRPESEIRDIVDKAVKEHGVRARALFRTETRNTLGLLEKEVLEAIRRVGNLAIGADGAHEKALALAEQVRPSAVATDRPTPDRLAWLALESPSLASAGPGIRVRGTPSQRLLDALAWFAALGIEAPGLAGLAFMAGYRPTSGTFSNIRGAARTNGLVIYPGSGLTALTAAGRARANVPTFVPNNEGVQAAVLAKLQGPERRILTALLPLGSEGMESDELAKVVGYSGRSGSFSNVKGRLRSLGLVVYPSPGRIAAAAILYPDP